MDPEEGECLYRISLEASKKGPIVEIGSYCGKSSIYIGEACKKNIGNAITRNRIKRKLKYAVQKISKESKLIDLNYTYVVFGKNNVYKDKFASVLAEVNEAFKKIKQIRN